MIGHEPQMVQIRQAINESYMRFCMDPWFGESLIPRMVYLWATRSKSAIWPDMVDPRPVWARECIAAKVRNAVFRISFLPL